MMHGTMNKVKQPLTSESCNGDTGGVRADTIADSNSEGICSYFRVHVNKGGRVALDEA